MSLKTKITFYGGVHEIGGNKFLVEDRGTKVFLDFGMQMGKVNDYFSEFLNPRGLNGMGDLFEFGLLPKIKGLYRQDYAKHMGFDGNEVTAFDGVILTHAHVDHAAYIHYLRPDIPIYCSEATKLVMQAFQDTGSKEEYITLKKNFQIYKNDKGQMSRGKGEDFQQPRKIEQFRNDGKTVSIDSIEVEPLPVDHSIPGVNGLILHTSNGSIAYTADLRYHGRRASDTQKFVERCGNSSIDIMLCEGTRVDETFSKTEIEVEQDVRSIVSKTKGLVVCTYPTRDLDRLLSFYNATKESDRDLVIDLKQAYLLKLFQGSDQWKNVFPKPEDKRIRVYIPRRKWGLIGKDVSYWTEKQLLEDYDKWEREFIDYRNAVNYQNVSAQQKDFIFYCSDYQLQQLIDVRPKEGSCYIRSQTEPFDDEMELKEERVKRWIIHFGLFGIEKDFNHTHVSGHGSGDQIKRVIEGTKAKKLVPIHTEHEEYHKKWHQNTNQVEMNGSIGLT
ncbi:MAG: MBL fold metallo-hydrolase [Nitrososphaera sp.]